MAWTSLPSTTSSPEATTAVGDDVGFEIAIGLDLAASERFQGGHYRFGDERRTPAEQIDYVADPVETYDLVYVEDPLEEDFTGFAELTERVGDRAPICGDDLYVTDVARIERGIDAGAGNSVLVKPNQIGTPSATVDAVELAVESGLAPVVSRQSGETEDATIAHLAVAVDSPYLKAGAVGGERTAKLNELVRIEAGAAGVRQVRRRSVGIW